MLDPDYLSTVLCYVVSMEYLVRFVQVHESFRRSELEALAVLANVNVEVLFYSEYVCFLMVIDRWCAHGSFFSALLHD